MGDMSCRGIVMKIAGDHPHWDFSTILWCFEMRCQVLLGSLVLPKGAMLFCFCDSVPHTLSHSLYLSHPPIQHKHRHTHTHWFILPLFTLLCSCFLPLSGWQSTPNKMEFGTFAKTAELPSNASVLSADWVWSFNNGPHTNLWALNM